MSKSDTFGGITGVSQPWRRYVPMIAVLIVGILLTVIVTGSVYNANQASFRDSLAHHTEDVQNGLQVAIDNNLKTLDTINGLYIASDEVSRVEFQTFLKKLLGNNPSIQALEWVPKVDRDQRETYEQAALADGLSGFRFTQRNTNGELVPAEQRDFYFPVFYAEPMKGNESALGFDLASDPSRLNALTLARDTGQPVATTPIRLVQESGEQVSILIAHPIYRRSQPIDTVENRQKAFLGFALGVYRVGNLVESALSAEDREDFNLYIYDAQAPAGQNVLYTNGLTEANLNRTDSLATSLSVDVAGRQWEIYLYPTAKYLANQPNSLPFLLAGLFFTLILMALVAVAVNRANITALAVDERTRDLRKTTVGLETVATVSAAAASILDLDELLNSVVDLAKASFNFYHAHIYLLDQEGKYLMLAAGAGEVGRAMKTRGHQIPLVQEHSLVARAARTRQGVVANNVLNVPDFLPNAFLPDTRSELAVPLVVADRLIGVLDVQSETLNRFTDEDIRIQETLADQIAIAVQNARAFVEVRRAEEETVKRAAELETVAQVSVAVTTILAIDELLQKVADLTKERFNLYHAHIYLLNKEGDSLVLAAGAGEVGRTMKGMGRQISLKQETSLVARAARERRGVIVNDVTLADDFLPNPLLPETRSEMAIPMIVGETLIGVLDTQATEVDRFTPEDIRVKTTLAEQIAVAVQNARAFVEMRAAEASLKESTTQLLEAQQLAKLGRWTWNMVTGKIAANDQVYEIFDMPRDQETTFDTFIGAVHPDDRQHVTQVITDTLQSGGTSYTLEYRVVAKNGEARDVFALGSVTRAEDGTPIEVIGTAQDITERRRLEAESRILYEAASKLTSAANPDQLLHAVNDYARTAGASASTLLYIENDAQGKPEWCEIVAESSVTATPSQLGARFYLPEFPFAKFWMSSPDKPLLVDDILNDERVDEFTRTVMSQTGIRGSALLPLNVQGRWVGLLSFSWTVPHSFTESEQRIYTGLAAQATPAVEALRSFREVETARQRAETLAQINAALSAATDERAILSSVGLFAEQYKPMALSIGYLEEDAEGNLITSTTMAFWQNGGLVPDHPTLGVTIDLTKLPFTALWAAEPNEALLVEDFDTDPRVDETTRELMRSRNVRATAAIPLHSGGRWQAIIAIQWGEIHKFAADERSVYGSLTQTAAAVVASRRAFLAEEEARRVSERRASELTLVANVSAAVSSILDVDELLKTVVELTKESFGLYHAHIYLLDDAAEYLVLAAGAGDPGRFMKMQGWRIAVANEHSLVARAARTRNGITVNDVTQVPDFLPNALLPETRSEMAIPMIVGGKLIGVLDVQSERVGRFSDEDVRIKTALADQVAVAVENASAFTIMVEAREDLNVLYEVSAQINAAQDEQQLVNAVVANWSNQEATAASLVLFENGDADTAAYLTRVGDWTRSGQSRGLGVPIPMAGFPILKLLDRHEVGVCDDADLDPRIDETTLASLNALAIKAFIFTPITIGERWIGTFGIYSDEPHEHTEREIRIMRSIGEQLTAAVERLNLVRQAQKRAIELETVAKVSAAASSLLNVNELLQTVVDLTKESFSLYHAHVYLLDTSTQTLVLAAGAGEPGRAMKARGHNISLHNEHSLVAGAARSRRSVVVNDVTKSPNFLPNPLLPDTRSEMSIPLVVGDRLLGVLDVQADSTSVFTNQEVQIMTTLGDQVAVAVQNAQLYEQQTEAAEQLRAVDRLKSEFLANMSHELRTPLNSIIGYAEVMIDGIDGELPEEAIEDVQAIHDSGQHLLSMINDILDLAKIEAGRMELDLETVKLDDVAEEVRRITSVLYKDKPVELVIDINPDLPEVWADQVRLRQIMTNLVSNAGKFTQQGEVRLTARPVSGQDSDQPDMVSIAVADTGEGIAEEHLDLVFQQFRQADNSSTRKAGGTGLGLTITKHLIEMQGGHIWVESTPGKGSTFTFTVPVAKVSVAQ